MRERVPHSGKVIPCCQSVRYELHHPDATSSSRPNAGEAGKGVGLLVLDERDSVAVATRELAAGDVLVFRGGTLQVVDSIPVGHKLALEPLPRGCAVKKYGEVIGTATVDIAPGAHVHVHNVVSQRLPGPTS
jgi:altronate dehydratase small subunit